MFERFTHEFTLPEVRLVRAERCLPEEFETVQEITVAVTAPRASDPGRPLGTGLFRTFLR